MVVGEDFLDIFLGGFGIETEYRAQTILFRAVAVVGGDGVLVFLLFMLLQFKRLLFDAHVVSVPGLGQVVAVEDQALPGVEGHIAAHHEVGGGEELLLLQGHAGVVGVDGLFGQLR